MEIVANYSSLHSSLTPPSYRAGSSLKLSCEVDGDGNDDAGLIYEWTSTCEGSCFAREGTLKTVSSKYLHSYDKGVHTCVVHNPSGCSGNASITVNVVGTAF